MYYNKFYTTSSHLSLLNIHNIIKYINMIKMRPLLAGTIVWSLIFSSFLLMSILPEFQESKNLQNITILILIVPFVILANRFYYRDNNQLNGFYLGFLIIICCLVLDALITLPLVILPEGGSYSEFYTDPGLIIMGAEILLVSYFYFFFRYRKSS